MAGRAPFFARLRAILRGRWCAFVAARPVRDVAAFARDFGGRTLLRALRDGRVRAGHLAFLLLFTLFPLAILIVAVAGLLGETELGRTTIASILATFPEPVAQAAHPAIEQILGARSRAMLLLGALGALWVGSDFVDNLVDASFLAYRVRRSGGLVRRRLRALVAILVVIPGALFFGAVSGALSGAAALLAEASPPPWLVLAAGVARWFLGALFLFLLLWLMLKLLAPPRFRHQRAWPGAFILAGFLILAARVLGSGLVGLFHLGLTYGALSGVMLLMLFFYGLSFAFILALEVNAASARRRKQAE